MKSMKWRLVVVVALSGFAPSAFCNTGPLTIEEVPGNGVKCAAAEYAQKQQLANLESIIPSNNTGSSGKEGATSVQ